MRMPSDLFTAMRQIAARIAPEIESLHILRQSDLRSLPVPIDTRAYANRTPGPALRQAIADAGMWHGPAPAIIFVATLTDRLESLGLFAHELSHLLPYVPPSDVVVTPAELEASSNAFATWATTDDVEADLPRWAAGHGREWLRVAAHLHHRMVVNCALDVPPRFIRHDEYDQSPLACYIEALRPELAATDLQMPFAEILKTPVTSAFTELFERDKNTWLQLHEVKK